MTSFSSGSLNQPRGIRYNPSNHNKPIDSKGLEYKTDKIAQKTLNIDNTSSSSNNLKGRVSKAATQAPDQIILNLANEINEKKLCLDNFKLSANELNELAPYLKYVEFNDLNFPDKELQEFINKLKQAEIINIKSNTITNLSLENSPNLQELKCLACKNLTTITLLKNANLQKLCCNKCYNLTALSLQENIRLQTLECNSCDKLTSLILPKDSDLQTLECSNCYNLTALTLPINSNLQTLSCNFCIKLTKLTIPENSCLQTLTCRHCNNLTILSLPENCSLQSLNCRGCNNLTTIRVEALPNLQSLDCTDCLLLEQLPQLPPSARVISGNSGLGGFHNFEIDLKTLEEDPLSVLLSLGRTFLLQDMAFPNIVFKDTRLDGNSGGIDAGGLRRHLISTLFQKLINNNELFTGEKSEKLPVLSETDNVDKKDAIKTIGKLFTLCLNSNLLTGHHFREQLFEAIYWLMNPENQQKDHLNERVFSILQGYDYDSLDAATKESIPDFIAENNIVYPAIVIAEQMKSDFKVAPEVTAKILQQKIQGKLVSFNNLIEKIDWISKSASINQLQNMQQYLNNWAKEMDKNSPEKLVNFVQFATGSSSLGNQKLHLEIYSDRDKELLPIAHTCFYTVEMPVYASQAIFNRKIEQALSSITGFQFR